MAQHPLRVIPLGGLGEIGKNMMALEYRREIIVIDAGVLFPEQDMLGVDLIIPDISYLIQNRDRVRAIFITHGHEDHTGALPYVLRELKVPVYAPRLAMGLISVKLKEHRSLRRTELVEAQPGKEIKAGPFRVDFFRVAHSIPDAMGLAIRIPLGMVIHTGDFKIDHTPVDGHPVSLAELARLCKDGVFLLLADSTYAELPGYTPSERVVGEVLDRVIGEAKGRVMIATFASLISRVQLIIDAAFKHGRKVGTVGRSMVNNVKMARDMGYLSDPGNVLVQMSQLRKLPRDKVVVVTTGSQGEPTSALVRIANREHREIQIVPGDTVVLSSTPIPGNETVVSRTIDNLFRQGAEVLYDKVALVHVHGHASQEELKMMLNLTHPKFFVPVHGAHRHLIAHTALAHSQGIPQENTFVLEDGDVLELSDAGGEMVGQIPAGHVYIAGKHIWDMKSLVMRDRQTLSRDGIVVVMMTVDKAGRVVKRPAVVSSGFVDISESTDLLERTSEAAWKAVGNGNGAITAQVKEALGSFLFKETGRRPMILPMTVEV